MQDLQQIRHYLHQHPELSGKESETFSFIRNQLLGIGVSDITSVGSPESLLAKIPGSAEGKNILFRCELDALPIHEENDVAYRSNVAGVSHKCGHDGHMTILLGLAEKLVLNPPAGNSYLLFQSAEEIGVGAQAVLDANELDAKAIDFVYALHNVPDYSKTAVVVKNDVFTPTVESLLVEFSGETSHAGEPGKGRNPAGCIAASILAFNALHQPNPERDDYFVVAPIMVKMGEESYGVSAGNGSMGYTFRCYDQRFFNQQKSRLEEMITGFAKEFNLGVKMTWKESFNATMNDKEAVANIKRATKSLDLELIEKEKPFDWGEDFGLFTQHLKGALFGFGAGKDCFPLHDSRYDFPDDITTTAINLFYQLANDNQV